VIGPNKKHGKKGRHANKIGRNERPIRHRASGSCPRCKRPGLNNSRVFSTQLDTYIPRGVTLPRDSVVKVA
jgi:hypothetical protein